MSTVMWCEWGKALLALWTSGTAVKLVHGLILGQQGGTCGSWGSLVTISAFKCLSVCRTRSNDHVTITTLDSVFVLYFSHIVLFLLSSLACFHSLSFSLLLGTIYLECSTIVRVIPLISVILCEGRSGVRLIRISIKFLCFTLKVKKNISILQLR